MAFKKGNIIGSATRIKKGQKLRLGVKHTEATKKKMMGRKCSLGFKHSEKTKKILSKKMTHYLIERYKKYPNLKKQISEKISGENSPHWKGGKSFEPYTLDWTKTLRRSIRERDKYTCQLCGELQSDITFSVHHIDYDKKNCDPNNLITLCKSCHSKTNNNREYWTNLFS